MPAENFYPFTTHTSVGYDQFTACCSNKSNDVRPSSPARTGTLTTDDSKYNTWNTYKSWGYQCWKLDWPDGPIGAFVSMTASASHRHLNGGNTARNMYFYGSSALGGGFNNIQDSATWAVFGPTTITSTQNPGSGAWDAAHVTKGSATERSGAGACYPDVDVAATGNFSGFWGVLTYTPPAGGFVFLLGCLAYGAFTHIAQLEKLIAWRRTTMRGTVLTSEEVQTAWQELKAYTHPSFHFMNAV